MSINEFIKGQISENCYLIQRDVRPCSLITIQKRYVDEAKKLIPETLQHYSHEYYPDWYAFYIFKYDHIKQEIVELDELEKLLKTESPPISRLTYDCIVGRLFGYSESEISEWNILN